MKSQPHKTVHDALDGGPRPPAGSDAEAELRRYEETLDLLREHRVHAPPDLADRIMERLPPRRRYASVAGWLPPPRQWLAPAMAGAALALLALFAASRLNRTPKDTSEAVVVHFELHAPDASIVELVGTFNHWQRGAIRLEGPDASGHWQAKVSLPAGRYEYQFLVDGRRWVTDPAAAVLRPDGFGKMNAILEVAGEGTTL